MRTIEHWIGGSATPGSSTRTAPVCNPATGEQQAAGRCSAEPPTWTPRSPRRPRRSRSGAQASLCAAHARCMFAFRELVDRHIDDLAAARHRRARQGALRRARRGAARPRGGRVRLRHPAAAQGRLLRPGLDRRRRLTRSASRSASSPASPRSTSRSWCRCGCTRSRSPAATRSCSSRASATRRRPILVAELWRRGRPAGRRVQRRARRQGGRRRAARPPRRRRGVVRRLDPDRPVHPRSGRAPTGKRVQALGGAKNHAVVLPDADLDFAADHLVAAAFGSAGQRCMAISAVVAVGAAADALVERSSRARPARSRSGRAATPASEMGPVVTAAGPGPRSSASSTPARQQGATLVGRRPRPRRRPATRTASSSARPCSTTSPPTWTSTARRSSARCCRSCASTPSTRRSS